MASLLLLGGGGTGCMWVFPPPEPPTPRLTRAQVRDVLGCQEGIHKAGRWFVSRKMRELEGCAADILAIRLAFENEILSEDEYQDALDRVRQACNQRFRRITWASTRFVDRVIDSCRAAEPWILGWDSLSFQILASEAGSIVEVESLEDLAGSLCVAKELFVDQTVFVQMPRLLELLLHLGPEYVVIYDENSFDLGFPNIPLDPRCPVDEAVPEL